MRDKVHVAIVLAAVSGVVLLVPASTGAAPFCPVPYGWGVENTDTFRAIKVWASSFDEHIQGVTGDEARLATIQAGEAWNEQANSGTYYYAGTTESSIPDFEEDCEWIYYSVVRALPGPHPANRLAELKPKCRPGPNSNVGQQFEIRVYGKYEECDPWDCWEVDFDWTAGTPVGGGQYDIIGTLVHELGHGLNIEECPGGKYAVMSPEAPPGTDRDRDLYHYDIVCAAERGGERAFEAEYVREVNGVFQGPFKPFQNWDVAKAAATSTRFGGEWDWAATFARTNFPEEECDEPWHPCWYPVWTKGLDENNANLLEDEMLSTTVSIGPRAATRMDDFYQPDMVLYGLDLESPMWHWAGKHRVRLCYSDDLFETSNCWGLEHCVEMGPGFSCAGGHPWSVYSGKPVIVAYDDYNEQMVTAWVNQNRLMDEHSRELLIAVGYVEPFVLPTPLSIEHEGVGIQAKGTPGLACKKFEAGPFDCVVTYVRNEDTTGQIKAKRFYSSWSNADQNYRLNVDPAEYEVGGSAGASSLTTWFDSGFFYLAYRDAGVWQGTKVLRSDDGRQWQLVASYGVTDPGPVAASYRTEGGNIFMMVK